MVDLFAFCRLVLAFTFLAAVYGAVRDWTGFQYSANRLWGEHGRVPRGVLRTVALVEAATAGLLLLPERLPVEIAATVAALFLVAFTVLLARVLVQGRDGINCHCFGVKAEEVSGASVARNSIFLAMAVASASGAFIGVPLGDRMQTLLVWAGPAVATSLMLANANLVVRMVRRPPRFVS